MKKIVRRSLTPIWEISKNLFRVSLTLKGSLVVAKIMPRRGRRTPRNEGAASGSERSERDGEEPRRRRQPPPPRGGPRRRRGDPKKRRGPGPREPRTRPGRPRRDPAAATRRGGPPRRTKPRPRVVSRARRTEPRPALGGARRLRSETRPWRDSRSLISDHPPRFVFVHHGFRPYPFGPSITVRFRPPRIQALFSYPSFFVCRFFLLCDYYAIYGYLCYL